MKNLTLLFAILVAVSFCFSSPLFAQDTLTTEQKIFLELSTPENNIVFVEGEELTVRNLKSAWANLSAEQRSKEVGLIFVRESLSINDELFLIDRAILAGNLETARGILASLQPSNQIDSFSLLPRYMLANNRKGFNNLLLALERSKEGLIFVVNPSSFISGCPDLIEKGDITALIGHFVEEYGRDASHQEWQKLLNGRGRYLDTTTKIEITHLLGVEYNRLISPEKELSEILNDSESQAKAWLGLGK